MSKYFMSKSFLKNTCPYVLFFVLVLGQFAQAQSNVCPPSANFNLLTPCYVNGSRAANPAEPVIVLFNHATARGESATKQVIANYSEVGTVWGMAWHAQSKKVYAAAFLKRHCDLSPDGLGAIYEIDLTTATTAGAGTPTLWMNLNTATHLGAGATLFPTETASNRGLAGINTPNHDVWAYNRVGKQGLGDIEISADGTTMYAMDLTNRQVLQINMATKTVTNRYAVTAPANYANAADRRPFGIKHHNGELYIGVVSSGETGEVDNNLRGTIMKLSGSTFTSVFDMPSWDYRAWPEPRYVDWYAYTANDMTIGAGSAYAYIQRPVPLISDIEFDNAGNLVIGVMDWSAHRLGSFNYPPNVNSTSLYNIQVHGDVIKANKSGTTWTMESDIGNFYDDMRAKPQDGQTWPTDTFMGGMVIADCNGTELVVANMQDPSTLNQGGTVWMKTSNGLMQTNTGSTPADEQPSATAQTIINGSRIQLYRSDNDQPSTFGKAAGLGDMIATFAPPASPCTALSNLVATATPSSIATGGSSTLNVTGTGITAGTTTFAWAKSGGGFSATTQNPSTGTLSTAGGYSYTVTATNANGTGTCTATATTSLTVSTVPNPCTALSNLVATATPSSIATGGSSTLNVTGTGITAGTTTFAWAGTGGFTATTQNPSTGALSTAGGYSYTVTATNANGTGTCTATATTSLTVSTVPNPCTALSNLVATATPSSIATGGSSTLNVTGTGITAGTTTFAWAKSGGGFSATTQNPSTGTLSTAGGYSYTVTATNANGTGTCTATATTSLTVSTVPNPCTALSNLVATATPSSIATGASSTLNVTGTGITAGTTTFAWAKSGGGFSATTQNPSTGALSTAGGYSYTVTATNANGTGTCTATATTSLTVSTVPNPCTALSNLVATATPSSITAGALATLSLTGTGITAGTTIFSWAGTGGFTATTQNPSTGALSTAGGYSYTVTATNANGTGTCTATATTSLTVNVAPVFDLALKKELVPASPKNPNVTVGSNVTYRISVINQGNVAATNVQVTDYVPSGWSLVSSSDWGAVSGGKTVSTAFNVGVGATVTKDITLTVGSTTGAVRNFAEISSASGGTDVDSTPDGTNQNQSGESNANMEDDQVGENGTGANDEDDHDFEGVTVNVAPVFDLALRKTLAPGQSPVVTVGSTVTFTISVINQGNVDATNVQVTDYIPAGLTLADAGWSQSGGTASKTIASVSAGQTVNLTISFTVSSAGTIVNTAEISSAIGGTDVDSTPDANNGNDGTVKDDVVGENHKSNPNDDEDDHDIATISTNCGTPTCGNITVRTIR